MFIKLGQKHASKDGIELAVFEAFGEVLIEALSFGFGIAKLVLIEVLSFVHTVVYNAYKQTHNQEKEIKALSLSSIQK